MFKNSARNYKHCCRKYFSKPRTQDEKDAAFSELTSWSPKQSTNFYTNSAAWNMYFLYQVWCIIIPLPRMHKNTINVPHQLTSSNIHYKYDWLHHTSRAAKSTFKQFDVEYKPWPLNM